jgi:poly(A) polymerase Pap1
MNSLIFFHSFSFVHSKTRDLLLVLERLEGVQLVHPFNHAFEGRAINQDNNGKSFPNNLWIISCYVNPPDPHTAEYTFMKTMFIGIDYNAEGTRVLIHSSCRWIKCHYQRLFCNNQYNREHLHSP